MEFILALAISGAALCVLGLSFLAWWCARRGNGWLTAKLLLLSHVVLFCGISRLLTALAAWQHIIWPCIWANWLCAGFTVGVALVFSVPALRKHLMPERSTDEWLSRVNRLESEVERLLPLAARGSAADVVRDLLGELKGMAEKK